MNNYTSSRFQRRAEDLIKITNEKRAAYTVEVYSSISISANASSLWTVMTTTWASTRFFLTFFFLFCFVLLFILKRVWHNWSNCGRKRRQNSPLLCERASWYQLTDTLEMQEWTSCLWQRPKMDNYEETSGGGQPSKGRYILKSSPPPLWPLTTRRKAQSWQWQWQIDK